MFTDERLARKKRSEKLLESLGADFLPSLPYIEIEKETIIRNPVEIGKRIICLVCVAAAADNVNQEIIINWLQNESLYLSLTKKEKSFLNSKQIKDKEKNKFSWASENAWLLLWSVGKVKRSLPTEECNIQEILNVIPSIGTSITEFLNSLKTINKNKILDMSDFLYRAHWSTRQYELAKDVNIGDLNSGVVSEWHYAVNWLTNYESIENWDDITTDT